MSMESEVNIIFRSGGSSSSIGRHSLDRVPFGPFEFHV